MNSAIETKLSQLDVDKSNWIPVKFGDIAFEPKESVKDAVKEGIEHVVGLEHIEANDIHLRRSNSIEESTTFSKKFSPNDVLFGRRRAYLKKAAQAQFTGICSGDIIVMRAKDVLMPELLPFIVNNDKFFDWAITHSAGGLSPRCKFKDLANYEFLLPPKEQQAEIAELLWSMDDVIEKNIQLELSLKNYYSTLLDNLFSLENKSWEYKNLFSLAHINKKSLNSRTDKKYQFKYLDLSSIEGPKVLGGMKLISYEDAPSRAKRVVSDGSTVFALVRPYQQSIVYLKHAQNIISSTGTAVIDAKENINSRFLFHQFFSKRFLTFCKTMMTGTNYPAITADDLGLYKMAIPKSKSEQDQIVKSLDAIESAQREAAKNVSSAVGLQKSLINQVF
jgi:type I restriction enzyme S subunit